VIGTVAPEAPHQATLAVDHEVAAELTRVFGRPSHTADAVATDQLEIALRRPQSPDAGDAAAPETEGPVAVAVGITERDEPERVARLLLGERLGIGEGHEDDGRLAAELVDAVAHGARVVDAGQSMDVAMEHQHDHRAALVGEPPRAALGVEERDVGGDGADGGSRRDHADRTP
jgi:hypothetical protein